MRPIFKIMVVPLLAMDCFMNWFPCFGAITETMSAHAARMREKKQPIWGWTAGAIDMLVLKLFNQTDHCNKQLQGEIKLGGAWGVWRSL